jgi:hypothetical protein
VASRSAESEPLMLRPNDNSSLAPGRVEQN